MLSTVVVHPPIGGDHTVAGLKSFGALRIDVSSLLSGVCNDWGLLLLNKLMLIFYDIHCCICQKLIHISRGRFAIEIPGIGEKCSFGVWGPGGRGGGAFRL